MNPIRAFTVPEYLFRPRQIVTRLQREFTKELPSEAIVKLPWGDPIRIQPTEVIGSMIWYYGLFDLLVVEALTRLLDPGELALDIGANIGQMTGLMRLKVGPKGRVIAFEPHPQLFSELNANMTCLDNANHGCVETHCVALSDHEGDGFLGTGPCWTRNRGQSKLVDAPGEQAFSLRVPTKTLSTMLNDNVTVGVCKIDVEGHELKVFQGARQLLVDGRVRDLIFEDFEGHSSQVARFLVGCGFRIFSLSSSLFRPYLGNAVPVRERRREGDNFLATRYPERALERFASPGWKALKRTSIIR